jgi:translation elongation factor EF-Ts
MVAPKKKTTKKAATSDNADAPLKKTTKKTATRNKDNATARRFIKLEDGVLIDLYQVQAYRHKEGSLGTIYLTGGNSLETHCGQELMYRIMDESS